VVLDELQTELEARFTALAETRRPLGHPVYAIEHGLQTARVVEASSAGSEQIQRAGPQDRHWLVWAMLGAEAGYGYAGEEYWPTLEVARGEWRNNCQRAWLRRRFQRFHERFGGPVPVGRWAQHFNIISWPIANAILPRYLQSHFAGRLYTMRYALADRASSGASRIGALLADGYDGASSRFADFLQQTELTAQIVLALRDEDLGSSAPRIEPAVLERIIGDLESRRAAREYLRAARKVISAPRASASSGLRTSQSPAKARGSDAPIVSVALVARPTSAGEILTGLLFPDIAAALARSGLKPAILDTLTITMHDPGARPEPGLALLGLSRRDRPLQAMPAVGETAVKLEGGDWSLRQLIEPLLCFAELRCHVLRRHADGLFRELRIGQIRPGESYILLLRSALAEVQIQAAGLVERPVRTTGLFGYELQLPEVLERSRHEALTALGLAVAQASRIEPLGLAPGFSDSDSLPAWQLNEPLLFRISANFEVPALAVQVDDGPMTTLAISGDALIVALQPMSPGRHSFSVQAIAAMGQPAGETARFEFAVNPPESWPDQMRGKSGFRLLLEPADADLEAVLAARAHVRLFGPAERTATWSLETFDAMGHRVNVQAGVATKPGDDTAVASALDRLRQSLSDAIDIAHRVDIIASIGELGRQSIAFPRRVDPLRWTFDPPRHRARLVDETAHEHPVTVRRYSLCAPIGKADLDYDEATVGVAVAPPGELLVAAHDGKRYSMFASVPAAERLRAFAELDISQRLNVAAADLDAVLILLSALTRWGDARPVGPQAILRKTMTCERIAGELASRACGRDFTAAIAAPGRPPLVGAQSMIGGSPGFGVRMRTFPSPVSEAAGLQTFQALAHLYGIDDDDERCMDAYRLAFAPASMRFATTQKARDRLAALLANPRLVRGAHLAAAAVQTALPGTPTADA
jgi:hypothetical protein